MLRNHVRWTPELEELVKRRLGEQPFGQVAPVVEKLRRETGQPFTDSIMKEYFRRRGWGRLKEWTGKAKAWTDSELPPNPDRAPVVELPSLFEDEEHDDVPTCPLRLDVELIERVLAAVKHRALDYVALADKLNAPTADVKQAVQLAIKGGYDLHINDGNVSRRALMGGIRRGDVAGWNERDGRHLVAIVSDTHIGNMWTAEDELTRFIRYAYSLGVRTIAHPGDVLDGNKKELIAEQYLVGFDRQSLQATRTFPALPGLKYFAQTGNHDEYTSTECGMDAGRALENRFREIGREDWHHVGRCGCVIRVESANWELLHPHGGTGTNHGVLGVLEKHVNERVALPNFMLTGHFHKYCTSIRKSCTMIGCATWQRKGSPFSNRIAGPWAVGGVIVDYNVDQDGRVDDVSTRYVCADRFAVAA